MTGVIAVYPDARTTDDGGTGIVALLDGDVKAATSLRRDDAESRAGYVDRVCDRIADMGRSLAHEGSRWMVAVRVLTDAEDRNTSRRTSGQRTAPVATAYVIGAVLRDFRARPVNDDKLHGARYQSKHGGSGKAADYYPAGLVGRRTAATPIRDAETPGNAPMWAAYDIARAVMERPQ